MIPKSEKLNHLNILINSIQSLCIFFSWFDIDLLIMNTLLFKSYFLLDMGPDPIRAYFWPAVNKRSAQLWSGYFPTRPEAIFFDPKGKKLKNLTFLGEIFQILTQTINGWPDPTQDTKNWPNPTRVKIFWSGTIITFYRHFIIHLFISSNLFPRMNALNSKEWI